MKPRRRGETGTRLSVTEQLGLAGGDREGRDVVQRRGKRKKRPNELPRLSGFVQKVQRNGLIEIKRAGACAAEHGDMTDGAERLRDVAGEAADVGALGDGGGEGRLICAALQQTKLVDRDVVAFISNCSPARDRWYAGLPSILSAE